MAAINKRGKYWRAQVRRVGHAAQSKYFDTKAEAWARQVERPIDAGGLFDSSQARTTTLREALERYRDSVAARKLHPYQENQRISRWLKHKLAGKALADLRGKDFAEYRDARRDSGRAENTIRLELQLINHLFELARKEWGFEGLQNPLKNIRKPSGARSRDRRFGPGEFDLLYDLLNRSENPCVQIERDDRPSNVRLLGHQTKIGLKILKLDDRIVSDAQLVAGFDQNHGGASYGLRRLSGMECWKARDAQTCSVMRSCIDDADERHRGARRR